MRPMTPEAIAARREHKRRWYAKNEERVKEYNITYWEKRAEKEKNENKIPNQEN